MCTNTNNLRQNVIKTFNAIINDLSERELSNLYQMLKLMETFGPEIRHNEQNSK